MRPHEFEQEILKSLDNLGVDDIERIRKEVEIRKYEDKPTEGLTSSNNSCKLRSLNKERGKTL